MDHLGPKWEDERLHMRLCVMEKFTQVRMQIDDAEPTVVTPKTALFEARRRRYHLGNVDFYDLDGNRCLREGMSRQAAALVELFVRALLCPKLHKLKTSHRHVHNPD